MMMMMMMTAHWCVCVGRMLLMFYDYYCSFGYHVGEDVGMARGGPCSTKMTMRASPKGDHHPGGPKESGSWSKEM